MPTIEDAVKAGGFLAGRPEDIVEALKAVEKRYPGLDRVICATPLGTPLDGQLENLDPLRKGGDPRLPRYPDRRRGAGELGAHDGRQHRWMAALGITGPPASSIGTI